MQPIRDNIIIRRLKDKLNLEGLEKLETSIWEVVAKGSECGEEYKVCDIIEVYINDELPRYCDDGTYIIKDKAVLGVKNEL